MEFAIFLIFFGTLLFDMFECSAEYNRSHLQKKYPGFGDKYIPMRLDDGRIVIGYFEHPLESSRINLSPDPKDAVSFTFYSRLLKEITQCLPDESKELYMDYIGTQKDLHNKNNQIGTRINSTDDVKSLLDLNKPTKFVTHGWMSSGEANTCALIKNGFLQKYDANVIVMDWAAIAGNVIYPIPMWATKGVGKFYGEFLNGIVDLGVHAENIHLVGHSLGAHVSGFAAREVKHGLIGRITGLDPALPGFNWGLISGLSQDDAHFVDVIHTCAGFLGIKKPLGHADFYPNGGTPPQPGCGSILEMVEACSHGRSWQLFAASLNATKPFLAYNCTSFEDFVDHNSCIGDPIPMGDPAPTDARGDYYLKTEWTPSFT